LEPNDTEYFRGWVAAIDYILTGSLHQDAKELEGVVDDPAVAPEDYMAREPEE
jgi:hypothetical protein